MDISDFKAVKKGISGMFQKYRKKAGNNRSDEEEAPGDVKLNSGSRSKTPVVKRGFILGCMGMASAVLVYAYFSSAENKAPQSRPIQQEIINSHQPAQVNSKESSYAGALKASDSNRLQQAAGSHGASEPPKNQQPKPVTLPKIPQIGSLNNIPAALLPGGNLSLPATAREKTMEERYQSAITFYSANNGNNGDNSSNSPGHGAKNPNSVSYTAPSDKILQAGTLIPAMLFTGINTDSSGQVTAVVLSDIYDTATGTNLLIPAGSQIIGKYDGGAAKNGRVSLTFSVVVLPNGGSYALGSESVMAIDGAGYNGIKGKVHHHTDKAIRGSLFASTIAALGSIAAGNTSNTSNTYSAGQLAMQGAMANVMNSASNVFNKNAGNVTETVTIEPGYQFNLYVMQPIFF